MSSPVVTPPWEQYAKTSGPWEQYQKPEPMTQEKAIAMRKAAADKLQKNMAPPPKMGFMQKMALAVPEGVAKAGWKFTDNAPMIAGGAGGVLAGPAGAAGGGMLGEAMKQTAMGGTGKDFGQNLDPSKVLKQGAIQGALEGTGSLLKGVAGAIQRLGLSEKAMRFALAGTEDLTKETNPAALINNLKLRAATRSQLFNQIGEKLAAHTQLTDHLLKAALPNSEKINVKSLMDAVIDKNIDAAAKTLDTKAVTALQAMKKAAQDEFNKIGYGSSAMVDIEGATNLKRMFGKAANWKPGQISTEFQAAHDLVQGTRRQIYGAINDSIKGAIKNPSLAKSVSENNHVIREALEAQETLQMAADAEHNTVNYHIIPKLINAGRVPVGAGASAAARQLEHAAPVIKAAGQMLPNAVRAGVVGHDVSTGGTQGNMGVPPPDTPGMTPLSK